MASSDPASANANLIRIVERITYWHEQAVEALRNGTLLAGRFRLLEELGQGGFGVVFRAIDQKSGTAAHVDETGEPKPIALKLIRFRTDEEILGVRPVSPAKGESVVRLINEIRRQVDTDGIPGCVSLRDCSRLGTTHLDKIADFLQHEPLWFSMPVYACSLAEHLQDLGGKLPIDRAVDIMTRVADALQTLHGSMIHRDLKPENILLTSDHKPVVSDYGLSVGAFEPKVTGNPTSGTWFYMSPEQIDGDAPAAKSDIWSWGVIVYQLISGKLPFGGDDMIARIKSSTFDPLDVPERNCPRYLVDLVNRCLRRDGASIDSCKEVLGILREGDRERFDQIHSKIDAVQQTLGAKIDQMAVATIESHEELMKRSADLSNRGEHEQAYEVAGSAVAIARRLKDEDLERRYLVQQASVVAAAAETGDEAGVIDRLKQIQREFNSRLGTGTWHHLAVELWVSMLMRDHDRTSVVSRQILSRDDAELRLKVDALSALVIALSRLDRTPDLLAAATDLEELCGRIEIDDQVTLRANWLFAVAHVDLFDRSEVAQFLECLTAAAASNDLTLKRAGELADMVGRQLLAAAHRTVNQQWLEAAFEVLATGYRLVEPSRDAHQLLTLAMPLAECALDLNRDDDAVLWLERGNATLGMPSRFETPEARLSHRCAFAFTKARVLMRISERSDRAQKRKLLESSLTAFRETEALLEKCAGAIGGQVDLMSEEIAQRKAIILDRFGDFRGALVETRKVSGTSFDKRDSNWRGGVRLHEAKLLGRLGDINACRTITEELLGRSDLQDQLIDRIRGFAEYLNNRLAPPFDWLASDAAALVGQQAQQESLSRAVAQIHRPLVEWWKAWQTDEGSWPAAELFDFWGRGAFMRLVAAVRARPTQAITVDARTIDEIRHWARVFCPLFETVIIKWKGRIHSNCLWMVPRHISQGSPGDFGGHGYVSTAKFVREEWNVAMGAANPMPHEVCAFLATEALQLVEKGHLVVLPAPLVGASQLDVGWSDDLLSGGLLHGVVNAARMPATGTVGAPAGVRVVNVTTAAIPYMQGVSLPILGEVLDDLTDGVAALRKLWCSEISYVAKDEWQRVDGLTSDFADACRVLREQMAAVSKKPSIDQPVGEFSAGTSAVAAPTSEPDGPPITEVLRSLAGERSIQPWIPFWRLSESGGLLNWDGLPYRFARDDFVPQAHPASIMKVADVLGSLDHSWLCPGDAGCGIAAMRRVN